MIVIPPLTISELNLTSSNVVEPNAPANYNGATTYNYGQQVTDGATKLVYTSLQNSNVGKVPALYPLYWRQIGVKEEQWLSGTTYAVGDYSIDNHRVYQSLQNSNLNKPPLANPTYWLDIGPTMKYAMFDTLRNTASYAPSPITVVITPGQRCSAIGLVGLEAETVRVRVVSDGVTVYDVTKNLIEHSTIEDWYEYFTATFRQKTAVLFSDLPAITNMVVTVDIASTNNIVACGGLVIGQAVNLGAVQYNPNIDADNYSTIQRDTYGNSVLIPRRTVPRNTMKVWTPKERLNDCLLLKETLNAVPALWAGIEDDDDGYFASMVICGVYKQFSYDLSFTNIAELTLQVEEV